MRPASRYRADPGLSANSLRRSLVWESPDPRDLRSHFGAGLSNIVPGTQAHLEAAEAAEHTHDPLASGRKGEDLVAYMIGLLGISGLGPGLSADRAGQASVEDRHATAIFSRTPGDAPRSTGMA